jgi:hypothetical protein
MLSQQFTVLVSMIVFAGGAPARVPTLGFASDRMRSSDWLAVIPGRSEPLQSYRLTHTDGIESRGSQTLLVVHHARMYPASPHNWWLIPPVEERLPLELVPSSRDGKLTVRVLWQGEAQAGAEITADLAGGKRITARCDGAGDFSVEASEPGLYTFRSQQLEKVAGERDGKKYASILHYSTLVVIVRGRGGEAAAPTPGSRVAGCTERLDVSSMSNVAIAAL